MAERLAQTCTICGQTDVHPRHTFYDGTGENETSAHFDCHAEYGCGICKDILTKAPKAKRHGDALIAHLTGGAE